MTQYLKDPVGSLTAKLREESSKQKAIRLPDPKQSLRKCPLILQFLILGINCVVIGLFLWSFTVSFHTKNELTNPDTINSRSTNGNEVLACFPDIEHAWMRLPVYIVIMCFAILDLLSSLLYLKTLIESAVGRSCYKFLSYEKLCSSKYSFLVALQSIWIQQVSLSCASSDILGSFLNFSSGISIAQSLVMIFTAVLSIWVRMVESRCCQCIGKSSKEKLKKWSKVISAFLQLANFGISLYIWIDNVKDLTFTPSWLKWVTLILFPIWLLIRIIEYIANIFAHNQEQEQEGEGSIDQMNTSHAVEMSDFKDRDQQTDEGSRRDRGSYSAVSQLPSQWDDLQETGNEVSQVTYHWKNLQETSNIGENLDRARRLKPQWKNLQGALNVAGQRFNGVGQVTSHWENLQEASNIDKNFSRVCQFPPQLKNLQGAANVAGQRFKVAKLGYLSKTPHFFGLKN